MTASPPAGRREASCTYAASYAAVFFRFLSWGARGCQDLAAAAAAAAPDLKIGPRADSDCRCHWQSHSDPLPMPGSASASGRTMRKRASRNPEATVLAACYLHRHKTRKTASTVTTRVPLGVAPVV